jgi:peptidoglycan-N-acetylglucosamine deacetylase
VALAGLPVALTCDDAPSIAAGRGVRFDPARMDALRAHLIEAKVPRCVAFVIGSHARGEEERLARWLDAGYELGNHTDDHAHASDVGAPEFLASVERCHRLLERVGAFRDERRPWFRFPYLDRGPGPARRAELERGIRALGYELAPASVDFYDHAYEEPFERARGAGDGAEARAVGERYQHVASRSVEMRTRLTRREPARDSAQIAFFHFGPVSEHFLAPLLRELAARGVRWCGLEHALDEKVFREFASDSSRTGLVGDDPRSLGFAAWLLRRLGREADARGLFASHRLGPRWAHLL